MKPIAISIVLAIAGALGFTACESTPSTVTTTTEETTTMHQPVATGTTTTTTETVRPAY